MNLSQKTESTKRFQEKSKFENCEQETPRVTSLAVQFFRHACLLIICAAMLLGRAAADEMLVFIGTYTGSGSEGIYVSHFDTSNGELSSPELAGEAVNPSFLALHPSGRYLYAVNEVGDFQGQKSGAVQAFRIESPSGKLRPLNQVLSQGGAPCHLVVDSTGQYVLVANYSGGSVAAFPVREGGRLGPACAFHQHEGSSTDPRRQTAPHAHSVQLDPREKFACVADLGLDQIKVYHFDTEAGTLEINDPPFAKVASGAGPRHFAFHPTGKYAYVINELGSTVTAFAYDGSSGRLTEQQTVSSLPEGFSGTNHTADVRVHPSGRFLYGSNRGHDSLAVFSIDPETGRLKLVEHESTQGKTPRNFGIDPTGQFVLAANQNSNSVVVFRIDLQNGELDATGQRIEVPAPVCVKFLPRPMP